MQGIKLEPIIEEPGKIHQTDALIIGAGPAGLAAALEAKKNNFKVIFISWITIASFSSMSFSSSSSF